MKITGVKIEKLLLELTSPFRVAFGTITHSENVMIKVTTDEGVTGYGEAAPLAFVTAETTDSVLAALELFRTGLIGMDPLDIEAVHAMMDGLMGGNSSAKCAVDLAMYDIRGKAAGHARVQAAGRLFQHRAQRYHRQHHGAAGHGGQGAELCARQGLPRAEGEGWART